MVLLHVRMAVIVVIRVARWTNIHVVQTPALLDVKTKGTPARLAQTPTNGDAKEERHPTWRVGVDVPISSGAAGTQHMASVTGTRTV